MDRLIYTTLSGLHSNLDRQAITANNIANASTPGFRRDIAAQEARTLQGSVFESRIQSALQQNGVDNGAGQIIVTGNQLDISMGANNYLAVQAQDGSEVFTKRGDLRAGVTGLLETGDGHPVIGKNGPVTIPAASKIEIGNDGTISIQPKGAFDKERVTIGQLKLVTAYPEQLEKRPDNLFRARSGNAITEDSAARVTSGTLEGSNVNLASSMIDLIEEARRYEIQVKLVSTARDLDQSSSGLLQLNP